jgi:hypothetical protein
MFNEPEGNPEDEGPEEAVMADYALTGASHD